MEGKRKNAEQSKESGKKCRESGVYIRKLLHQEDSCRRLREAWAKECQLDNSEFSIFNSPFKCCIMKDFFHDEAFLNVLRDELSSLDLISKNNDLYQFHQSEDLANVSKPAINDLKSFLHGQCRKWLEDITGIELNNKVSVTCSCYSDTDYLLCHDDKCEDRRIAFILYINNDWKETDGGSLQLFDVGENGQPQNIVHSIFPIFNRFVFFEVTDKSFHQVAEVLTDKSRLTINGWFHSPIHCSRSQWCEEMVNKLSPLPSSEVTSLENYINPCYLKKSYYSEVSSIFEEESQISLVNFLKEEIYDSLCNALLSDEIVWEKRGPPNRRQYFVSKDGTLPLCVKSFTELFSSSAVFNFLRKLTNLDLGHSGEEDCPESSSSKTTGDSMYHFEVQKWEKGCYTLVNDDDPAFKESALDVVMYFNVDGLEEHHGGFTSYIARDEDLELLTVNPVENALALSYRDDETLRFVKYINHNFSDKFFSISFVYNE